MTKPSRRKPNANTMALQEVIHDAMAGKPGDTMTFPMPGVLHYVYARRVADLDAQRAGWGALGPAQRKGTGFKAEALAWVLRVRADRPDLTKPSDLARHIEREIRKTGRRVLFETIAKGIRPHLKKP